MLHSEKESNILIMCFSDNFVKVKTDNFRPCAWRKKAHVSNVRLKLIVRIMSQFRQFFNYTKQICYNYFMASNLTIVLLHDTSVMLQALTNLKRSRKGPSDI